eukprot:c26847_g1_i1 orf=458-640(+)
MYMYYDVLLSFCSSQIKHGKTRNLNRFLTVSPVMQFLECDYCLQYTIGFEWISEDMSNVE